MQDSVVVDQPEAPELVAVHGGAPHPSFFSKKKRVFVRIICFSLWVMKRKAVK